MASKVLVPTAPFAKLQVKKPTNDSGAGSGFVISGEPAARVAHLEHSVRFLQEQHRLMLSGLHAEIEALRERNRDLQFQLIFNKESSPKLTSPGSEENNDNEEGRLRREVARLEQEAAAARAEARAAEARALELQQLVDAQAEKIRELELSSGEARGSAETGAAAPVVAEEEESSAELRARLADAERLVRRLRGDAERQRREVLAGGVTNLLFDDAAARAAHLQCMKNSLHASLRATGLEGGFSPAASPVGPPAHHYNNYHFPTVHTPEFWREPVREEYVMAGRGRSRRLALPELAATGHNVHRSTVYANNHTRQRPNGYEQKSKKGQTQAVPPPPPDATVAKTPEDHGERPNLESRLPQLPDNTITYPELKIVVTKLLPRINASSVSQTPDGGGGGGGPRPRPRKHHQRKHATIDHT